jgi:hypothetical protein
MYKEDRAKGCTGHQLKQDATNQTADLLQGYQSTVVLRIGALPVVDRYVS